MPFCGRHFFARLGRIEVFAEGWKRNTGEPLLNVQRGTAGGFSDIQLWMPGLHLIVSY